MTTQKDKVLNVDVGIDLEKDPDGTCNVRNYDSFEGEVDDLGNTELHEYILNAEFDFSYFHKYKSTLILPTGSISAIKKKKGLTQQMFKELMDNANRFDEVMTTIHKFLEKGSSANIQNKKGNLPLHLFIMFVREFFNYFYRLISNNYLLMEMFEAAINPMYLHMFNYLNPFYESITHINSYEQYLKNLHANKLTNLYQDDAYLKKIGVKVGVVATDTNAQTGGQTISQMKGLFSDPYETAASMAGENVSVAHYTQLLLALKQSLTGMNLILSTFFIKLLVKLDYTIELLVVCDRDPNNTYEDKLLIKNKKNITPFYLLNRFHGEMRRQLKYYYRRLLKKKASYTYYINPGAFSKDIVMQVRKMFMINQGRTIKRYRAKTRKVYKERKNNQTRSSKSKSK